MIVRLSAFRFFNRKVDAGVLKGALRGRGPARCGRLPVLFKYLAASGDGAGFTRTGRE